MHHDAPSPSLAADPSATPVLEAFEGRLHTSMDVSTCRFVPLAAKRVERRVLTLHDTFSISFVKSRDLRGNKALYMRYMEYGMLT